MALGMLVTFSLLAVLSVGALALLGSRSRSMAASVGVVDGHLAPCPETPNCVCSDAAPGDSHYVAPIADPAGGQWPSLIATVAAMPGARLIRSDDRYAHFTFESRLFGFVDDVELHRRLETGEIAVRSASRVGRGDLGANRDRVEAIRAAL